MYTEHHRGSDLPPHTRYPALIIELTATDPQYADGYRFALEMLDFERFNFKSLERLYEFCRAHAILRVYPETMVLDREAWQRWLACISHHPGDRYRVGHGRFELT